MKAILITAAFIIISFGQILAQGPTLKLVGGSPSLAQGTINTEVLTAIIQQKQEEVKRKVFRNAIVKGFNYSNYTQSLKNFTTYHYLYSIMDVLTSGKNKTAITKSVAESSAEFGCVFGLALYIQKYSYVNSETKLFGAITLNKNVIEEAKVGYTTNKIIPSKNVKNFNLLIDLCYDVILTNPKLQSSFQFKNTLNDKDFKLWFQNDNIYYLDSLTPPNGVTSADLIKMRTEVEAKLNALSILVDKVSKDLTTINKSLLDLKSVGNVSLSSEIDKTLNVLGSLTGEELNAKILQFNTDYAAILTAAQKITLTNAAALIDANYNNYKEFPPVVGLVTDNFLFTFNHVVI